MPNNSNSHDDRIKSPVILLVPIEFHLDNKTIEVVVIHI